MGNNVAFLASAWIASSLSDDVGPCHVDALVTFIVEAGNGCRLSESPAFVVTDWLPSRCFSCDSLCPEARMGLTVVSSFETCTVASSRRCPAAVVLLMPDNNERSFL